MAIVGGARGHGGAAEVAGRCATRFLLAVPGEQVAQAHPERDFEGTCPGAVRDPRHTANHAICGAVRGYLGHPRWWAPGTCRWAPEPAPIAEYRSAAVASAPGGRPPPRPGPAPRPGRGVCPEGLRPR